MELGMIGLGRMGASMTTRLIAGGHRVVACDRSPEAVSRVVAGGATGAASVTELVAKLKAPRAVWVMVPSGEPTDSTLRALSDALGRGDAVVDGGNSYYRDSIRRGAALAERGIAFIDSGTSGGIWGLKLGYGLTLGGDAAAIERLRPVFETLAPAPDRGWGRVGPIGAGHFAKMVHNGIEYGLMQAFAEGFELLHRKSEFGLDLAQVGRIWQHGVVRSWLLELTVDALTKNPAMDGVAPWVDDSGEGRWTVAEAMDLEAPAPIITQSLIARFRSRSHEAFADRLLAALRNEFGGHAVKRDA